jgi:hypothetical protein
LYAAVAEAQEGDEAEVVEQPKEEWLSVGPQAPGPDLDQRPHRWATSRGTVAPAPAPAVRWVKKIASKSDKPDVERRHSSCLFEAKTPPAKQRAVMGVDSSSQSDSSSSCSSSSLEPPMPQQVMKLPGSTAPPQL